MLFPLVLVCILHDILHPAWVQWKMWVWGNLAMKVTEKARRLQVGRR